MEIIVDERERALFESFQGDIPVSTRVLPLGDILFEYETKPLLLIERKSFPDLLASIKDGRYKEQSLRMQYTWKPHQIIYLIEGHYTQLSQVADKNILFSAMTSLQIFKGFHIVRSSSLKDSADILMHMAKKISKELLKGTVMYGGIAMDPPAYSSVVKSVKKENVTPSNIGEIMLCQIPGIQTVTAQSIMLLAGSIAELIRILKETPEKVACIRVNDRAISKAVVLNLHKYLLSPI